MAARRSLSCRWFSVMAGHSRSKNGVASLAYVPAIDVLRAGSQKAWMPGTSPGMTKLNVCLPRQRSDCIQ